MRDIRKLQRTSSNPCCSKLPICIKLTFRFVQAQPDDENLDGTVMEAASDDEDEDSDKDFDYLMGMPMWSLTQEKKDELCRKR